MRSNRKILFGLFLIVGAFGFYRLFTWFTKPGTPAPRTAANTGTGDPNFKPVSAQNTAGRVAAARVNIPANTIVTPDMLRMVPNGTTEGYVTNIESQAVGFITRVGIPAGGKLRRDGDFVGHVSETGIAGLLRPGYRAMVVPLANKPTLHDLVRIGNYVDIIAAFDAQESRTLIQNVRVLGVDLSANDYPNVNVAMRGSSKANDKQGEAQPAGTPVPTNTPAPNAPRPDPAITLEVTPRQAAALQLAISSNASLDYLVRPAYPSTSTIPGNGSPEVAPIEGADGQPTVQTVSVVKPQIAPYAARLKNGSGGGRSASTGGGSGSSAPLLPRGGRRPEFIGGGPEFPIPGSGQTTPVLVPNANNGGMEVPPPSFSTPVPTPTQNYTIPIIGDGKILRTETVPLPGSSK